MEKLNFSNVSNIAGGDLEYQQELLELYIDLFKVLPSQYKTCLINKNTDKLEATIHRVKPSLITLGLSKFLEELKRGSILMEESSSDTEKTLIFIKYIETVCDDSITQLRKYQLESR